jgi:hypothetical protein
MMCAEMPDDYRPPISAPERGLFTFLEGLMSRIHIVKAESSADILMFCGARLSQNGGLAYEDPPRPALLADPDVCNECVKQLKVARREQSHNPSLRSYAPYERRENNKGVDNGYTNKKDGGQR